MIRIHTLRRPSEISRPEASSGAQALSMMFVLVLLGAAVPAEAGAGHTGGASRKDAETPRPEHPRLDHVEHGKKAPNTTCNDCHRLEAASGWEQKLPVGKGGGVHAACSSAGCHQDVYAKFQKNRDAAFCFTCHVGRFGKELVYPPYRERGVGDFFLSTFSHQEHIREGNKGCPQCHTALSSPIKGSVKEMKRVSHDRCGNQICHGEAIPPLMGDCQGCHTLRGDAPIDRLSSLDAHNYRVRRGFSHPAHRKKSPKDACGVCHTNVAVAKGQKVPLPPMIACESCHNGQAAFSALGTTCRRCHKIAEEK